MSNWRPLTERLGLEGPPILVDTIAEWMAESVWLWVENGWFNKRLGGRHSPSYRGYNPDLLREVGRKLRLRLSWDSGDAVAMFSLRSACESNTLVYLNLLDLLLHLEGTDSQDADGLNAILGEGGSAWRVVKESPGFALEKRVAPGVEDVFDSATQSRTSASDHLLKARSDLYGLNPDPDDAYHEAVSAVEAAAIPVICPKNKRATLSSIIKDIRNAPEKWLCSLGGMDDIRQMLELLWQQGRGRHGEPGERATGSFSPEEAEAALHLAATLVHWFQAGLVGGPS